MPRYGPSGRNPFAPPRARRVRRLAVPALAALAGGLIALGGAAVTGSLGGERVTTVVREDARLPPASDAPAMPAAGGPPAAGIQGVVARSAPGVVTVAAGGARLGSGFVVDRGGRILTNAHVLDDADEARITYEDGTERDARVLGTDPSSDLSVLAVEDPPASARPLPLGRSITLRVGDPVIAIGNPFGLERTATTGIVSALKRLIRAPDGFPIQNVIQTDAAVNSGNSGGPLLDAAGRVVGVNSQIATEDGDSDGVSFAVPIDTVRPVAESIIATGGAQHAWLGITGETLTPDRAAELGAEGVRGVALLEVDERGPARAAGLRARAEDDRPAAGTDLIVAVGGRPVADMADVSQAVASRRVGDRLAVTVRREGGLVRLAVTLADRPDDVGRRG